MHTNNSGTTGANQNGSGDIQNDPTHDPLLGIAARITGALHREHGVIVDAELIYQLLSRFYLAPLSTTTSS